MQGGRTFDNYFGTYPGADGLPAGTCQPRADRPAGAAASGRSRCTASSRHRWARTDDHRNQYNGGKMDGFVAAYQRQGRNGTAAMGYYDHRRWPSTGRSPSNYVLFDHFFSSTQYGIRNNRSYWVSAAPAPGGTARVPAGGYGKQQTIFDRLQAAGVSWKFYVQGLQPGQTYQGASPTKPETQTARVPLLDYARFIHDPALAGTSSTWTSTPGTWPPGRCPRSRTWRLVRR